ncbi:hypothetical protein [Actinomyces wuliandei]|uniref:hypothetical protein n=1 Tax=Actinomyces wuliandei TaxID=2057743 RepID=UPI000FD8C29B|nr:hypothetical protein [Actinomyces wuliandei]
MSYSDSDVPARHPLDLQDSPGTVGQAGSGLSGGGADGATGAAPPARALEALERRCDELRAQVVSLQAAAVVRAGIIEDQAARIQDNEKRLAEAHARLEARQPSAVSAVRAIAAPQTLRRLPLGGLKRRAAALLRRLRG